MVLWKICMVAAALVANEVVSSPAQTKKQNTRGNFGSFGHGQGGFGPGQHGQGGFGPGHHGQGGFRPGHQGQVGFGQGIHGQGGFGSGIHGQGGFGQGVHGQSGFGQGAHGQSGFGGQGGFGHVGNVHGGFGQGSFGQGGLGNGGHGQGAFGGAGAHSVGATCRFWCKTPEGQAFCCEDNRKAPKHPVTSLITKPGNCPAVRAECPGTRFGPQECSKHGDCAGPDLCCFDRCLDHNVCKKPLFG